MNVSQPKLSSEKLDDDVDDDDDNNNNNNNNNTEVLNGLQENRCCFPVSDPQQNCDVLIYV